MYYTIRENGYSENTEKKSVFSGYCKRCVTENEAKDFIAEVRAKNHGARHTVYAYVIGAKGGIKRCSDDGEPQGTGGLPVLSVIEKNDLKDVVIAVARHFGGILLGASGLARAYGKAAGDAVMSAGRVQIVQGVRIRLAMGYDTHARISRYFTDQAIEVVNSEFASDVRVTIKVKGTDGEKIIAGIQEASLGRVEVLTVEDQAFFLSADGQLDEIEQQA